MRFVHTDGGAYNSLKQEKFTEVPCLLSVQAFLACHQDPSSPAAQEGHGVHRDLGHQEILLHQVVRVPGDQANLCRPSNQQCLQV